MGARTSMLHVRMDDDVKNQATDTLAAMGMSVSEAVRLFLVRVVSDQAIPFDIKVPNAKLRKAMAEAEAMAQLRKMRFSDANALIADLEKATAKQA